MANTIVLATASYDHTIKMFDPHSGKSWLTIKVPETQINALALRYMPFSFFVRRGCGCGCGWLLVRLIDSCHTQP